MAAPDRDALIEAALTAWRPRSPDGQIHPHPAWADLSEEVRETVFHATLQTRAIESALDPEGLSTTARAVLGRITGAADDDSSS